MNFHLWVTSEWIEGDHSRRDWLASFEPQIVIEEGARLQRDLEVSQTDLLRVLRALSPERFLEEDAGMGVVAHLAP